MVHVLIRVWVQPVVESLKVKVGVAAAPLQVPVTTCSAPGMVVGLQSRF
jgi:hypothetical protein